MSAMPNTMAVLERRKVEGVPLQPCPYLLCNFWLFFYLKMLGGMSFPTDTEVKATFGRIFAPVLKKDLRKANRGR